MRTQLLPPTNAALQKAARLLKAGQPVAIPTETVYGLAANALNPLAVAKIFLAKGRPQDNPLIVHVSHTDQAMALAHFTREAKLLAELFWPGALTLVLEKKAAVPAAVTAGLPTVALRLPAHPVATELIQMAGFPLAAPSANASGRPSPTKAQHVLADLQGKIPLIIDGGPCDVGLESTVVTLAGKAPVLLRPGVVTLEQLRGILPDITVHPGVLSPFAGPAESPGMKYRHYAPNARMAIAPKGALQEMAAAYDQALQQGEKPCLLCAREHMAYFAPRETFVLDAGNANQLFVLLRELDTRFTYLIAEELPAEGVGLGIMNRLLRAAGFTRLKM